MTIAQWAPPPPPSSHCIKISVVFMEWFQKGGYLSFVVFTKKSRKLLPELWYIASRDKPPVFLFCLILPSKNTERRDRREWGTSCRSWVKDPKLNKFTTFDPSLHSVPNSWHFYSAYIRASPMGVIPSVRTVYYANGLYFLCTDCVLSQRTLFLLYGLSTMPMDCISCVRTVY